MAATSDVTENSEEKNSVEVVDLETEVSSQPNNTVKLEDLKVTELKSELEKRDLDKNGVKSVLIERLKAAIIEEGGDPDNYANDVSSDSCINKSLPPKETSETVETNGNAEPNDKLDSSNDNLDSSNENDKIDSSNMLDEKVDVPLQLLIDEEEAQLNDDDGLIEPEPPKEPEIESKVDESVKVEQVTPKSSKKNESAKTAKKPRSSMILLSSLMNTKTPNKEVKEKKIVKTTVQKKSTEATSTLSPRVLKVIGKSDKLKSPTVLAKSLWITNLPDNTRAADLKALFGKQGRVLSVKIVKSAKQTPGKCYGFVTMATSKDATRAVENLNHTELNGRKISVEKTQNEPGTLIKKSETKVLTFTAKKQTIKKEATTLKQSLPAQKDSKPVSKEASKDKATEGTKSSIEESRKKDDKASSAEKAKKEKERRSREHRDRERDLHRSVRRPVFKSRPFGFDRSRYGGYKQPFSSRPFSSRVGFGSTFKPRPNLLALQKLREEHYLRDRVRERREAERRRADERHRFIERKQREEAYRLEREKERLRMEREILDRERAEILRLEREKQRLERERLEREREELRRQAEIRRSTKRPFSRIEREPEPIWDERKKPLTKYDSRASFHPPPSSSSSRYEYLPRERPSFSREFERHPEKFGAPKHLDVLHRADFDREARREVTIRTRDERQVFSRSEFRERDNRRSFSSRERERHSSSRRENPREDWKHERRVHERIIPGPSSSTQRRMAYY